MMEMTGVPVYLDSNLEGGSLNACRHAPPYGASVVSLQSQNCWWNASSDGADNVLSRDYLIRGQQWRAPVHLRCRRHVHVDPLRGG